MKTLLLKKLRHAAKKLRAATVTSLKWLLGKLETYDFDNEVLEVFDYPASYMLRRMYHEKFLAELKHLLRDACVKHGKCIDDKRLRVEFSLVWDELAALNKEAGANLALNENNGILRCVADYFKVTRSKNG